MEVFKIDNRNRNDLLEHIEELARSYTPEWKFDVSNPDATSVIAMIYANQTFNNIKNMNQLMTKYHIEFANMYGVSQKAASSAKTICTFEINENMQSGAELKRGTQVIGANSEGNETVFALTHDICITTSSLTDVIGLSGRKKSIVVHRGGYKTYNYADGQFYNVLGEDLEKTDKTGIAFFDYRGANAYKQAIIMEFAKLPDMEETHISLRFNGKINGITSSEALARLFSDKDRYEFKYVYEGETLPFDEVACKGDVVELKCGRRIRNTIVLERKFWSTVKASTEDENLYLDNIELFMRDTDKKAEFLWNGRNELVEDSFLPFTNQPALYNEFYIGNGFLLEQHGAKARLHFRLDFGTYSTKEAAVYEPDLRIVKRRSKAEHGRPHYYCFVQEVSFDYFNGKGWKHLNTSSDMTVLFSKTENAGEYDITFEIPNDWEAVVVGGYEGNCIRIQVVKADNCYLNDVEYYYPIISDFKLSMDSQLKGIQPSKLSYLHGQIKENDISRAFGQMQYGGDYMFLGFDKRLPKGPVALFMDLEKQRSFKGVELEFSYSCQKGFKPLKVIDDTQMLQNSGIIRFIPPADMNEYEVEGERRYWIRLEDKNGYFSTTSGCVPVLNDIYLNAAYVENAIELDEQDYYIDTVTAYMRFPLYAQNILSAKIWVNEREQLSYDEMEQLTKGKEFETRIVYNFMGEIEEFYVLWQEIDDFDDVDGVRRCYCIDRSRNEVVFGDGVHVGVPQNTSGVAFKAKVTYCDGEGANLEPYAIDRFRSSVVSVEEVTNPIGAYGGTNLENINNALKRGSNLLSSRKRLVSKNDFIREAQLFSDTIGQVECVVEDGVISIVLLMTDYKEGDYSFRNIRDRLCEHLLSCCEITCGISDIRIVQPVFVEVSTDIWLTVPDMSKSLETKQIWLDCITDYLEPFTSGRTGGWRIGKLPTTKQIRLMLSTLEGNSTEAAVMENINITAAYTLDGRQYGISIDSIEKNPFMICCNGSHNVYINGI